MGIHPDYEGNGLARLMVEHVLRAARRKGLRSVRIGGTRHPATNRIHANFVEREDELGIATRAGNWVDIVYPKPS